MPVRNQTSSRWWFGVAITVVLIALCTVWYRSGVSLAEVTGRIASLNGALVFLLMAILPIGGFSVGVVYLVAGIKFGPVLGGVAVAAATAVHLLGTHWICRSILRAPLERFMAQRRHKLPHIPEGENVSVAAMAALVPGPPYFIRNYLLALSGVPLRVYFFVCLPIYVVRSYVTILLGDLGSELTPRAVGVLAAVYAVKLSICAYLIWRIRRRFKLEKTSAQNQGRAPASQSVPRDC
jgi:uncharacterized membrane protein YdjX (TVP38/TMEM64 family)